MCTNTPDSLISSLIRQVEKAYGSPIDTPYRFEALSEAVFKVTGTLLSVSTLKRMWGYIGYPTNPRRSTLDAMARYCGWADFESFERGVSRDIESGPTHTASIRPDVDVAPGDTVCLRWNPSRVCTVKYLGDRKWRVVTAKGTRLQPGDTFDCDIILRGEALYLSNLTRDGDELGTYVCGRKSGITFTFRHG